MLAGFPNGQRWSGETKRRFLDGCDVGRLEVAMQNSLAVRGVDGQGDLLQQQDFLFEGQAAERHVQRLAVDIFHRDVGLILELADFVDLADVFNVTEKANISATL